MRLTQLDGMLAFVVVAEQGGFTAAAAKLEVTPSALSQAVKQLESRLGTRLLERNTRSVALTEAGRTFLDQVGPAVDALLAASSHLDDYRDEPAGLLRLTMPFVTHTMLMRPIIAQFLAAHPKVALDLSLDDAFVDIIKHGFDAGIRLGDSVELDMVAVPLTKAERTCIVAAPAYVKRFGAPASIEALREHECIRHRFLGSGKIYRWELLHEERIVEVEVSGRLTLVDSLSMAQAALDGIGLAYTFERYVADHLAAGRLVPILKHTWPSWPGFCLYTTSRKQMPAKLRAFIRHCQTALATEQAPSPVQVRV
jgi:DNA-binding transcriptional LysR family regulator